MNEWWLLAHVDRPARTTSGGSLIVDRSKNYSRTRHGLELAHHTTIFEFIEGPALCNHNLLLQRREDEWEERER